MLIDALPAALRQIWDFRSPGCSTRLSSSWSRSQTRTGALRLGLLIWTAWVVLVRDVCPSACQALGHVRGPATQHMLCETTNSRSPRARDTRTDSVFACAPLLVVPLGGSASGSASVVTLISKRRRDPLDLIRYLYTWSNTRLWRKNRSPAPTGSTCIGTDLNRNFNDHWGQGGSSTSPCSDTYMGISAGSEPEVQAISDYFRLNLPIYGAIDWYGKFQSSGSFSRRVLRVFCVCLPL